MNERELQTYRQAQAIANVAAPENTDPLAFWCLVELIVSVSKQRSN
jgi:hypothetical protein